MPKFDAYYKWLGIPPSEQPPHHYRLLGITPFETDADVIDAAADRQMSFLRDCGNGPNLSESQRLLNQVSEARVTLLNATKKAAYDQALRQKLAPAAPVLKAAAAKPAGMKPAIASPADPIRINTGDTADRRAMPASGGGSSRWIAVAGAGAAVVVLAVVAWQFVGSGPSVAVHPVAVNTTPATVPTQEAPPVEPKPQPPKAEIKVQAPQPPVEAPKKPPESEPVIKAPITPPVAPPDKPPTKPDPAPSDPVSPEPIETKEPKKEFDPLQPRKVDPTKSGEKRPGVIGDDEPAEKRPVVVAQADPPAKEPKVERLPVPDRPAIQAAERLIKDLFKSEYASKKPEDRGALAKKLLAQGKESPDDAVARYVLFNESREVAVSVGDSETALAAFRETARLFDVNRADEEAALLSALANKVRTPEAAKLVIDAAVALIDSSIATDDYDSAKRALALASASARKTQNVALVTQLVGRTREIDQLKRDYPGAQAAQEKLKTSPDDAEANLAVGKFYALGKGDFERGLPHLAKGSDASLAALAKKDLLNSEEVADQVALGDEWWSLSEQEQRATMKTRAFDWYQRAAPKLTGISKVRVDKRLAEQTDGDKQKAPGGLGKFIIGVWNVPWKLDGQPTLPYLDATFTPDGVFRTSYGAGKWKVEGGEVRVISDNGLVSERYWLEKGSLRAECWSTAAPASRKTCDGAKKVREL